MIDANKIIIALDSKDISTTRKLLNDLKDQPVWIKVGMELFYSQGPEIIHEIKNLGFSIFLDLKLHDIPNTVYESLKSLNCLPFDMINVHCLGGVEMMKAARRAIDESTHSKKPLLIGVTILTSLSDAEVQNELTLKQTTQMSVQHLAQLAQNAGLDGVVASAQEVKIIKQMCGADFKIITPGIRPSGSKPDDQSRTLTPTEAIQAGSDFLVIGRPITKAHDPKEALLHILKG